MNPNAEMPFPNIVTVPAEKAWFLQQTTAGMGFAS
jgi:hypothetical protein